VPVQQHAVVADRCAGGRDVDVDQRGTAFQAHHLQRHARDVLRAGPALHQLDGLIHVAVRLPIGVEHRRFVGNGDVIDQLRDDLVVPFGIDELAELAGVEDAAGHLELQ